MERWAELGRRVAGAAHLILIGGEADYRQLDFLSEAWRGLPVTVARELPLPLLAAILQRCSLFLGHDSGISHLAAAVETPGVLLFGPTDPEVWAPANPQAQVLPAPEGQWEMLTVDEVWARLSPVLSAPPRLAP